MMDAGRIAKRTGFGGDLIEPLTKISMWRPAPALHREQHTLARLACLWKVHKCFAFVKL